MAADPSVRRRAAPKTKQQSKSSHLVQLLSAVIVIIAGVILLGLGFFAPPKGEIHPTVLVAFGEILTFAGTLLGIDYHYKFKALDK